MEKKKKGFAICPHYEQWIESKDAIMAVELQFGEGQIKCYTYLVGYNETYLQNKSLTSFHALVFCLFPL